MANEQEEIKIDSSTPEAWAETWITKFRAMIKVYTSEYDLRCDMLAGDLPWDPDLGQQVDDLIRASPNLPALLKEFEDKFHVNYLARAFGVES